MRLFSRRKGEIAKKNEAYLPIRATSVRAGDERRRGNLRYFKRGKESLSIRPEKKVSGELKPYLARRKKGPHRNNYRKRLVSCGLHEEGEGHRGQEKRIRLLREPRLLGILLPCCDQGTLGSSLSAGQKRRKLCQRGGLSWRCRCDLRKGGKRKVTGEKKAEFDHARAQ